MGAVKNAMQRDELDPTIMDLDPEKSLESQRPPKAGQAPSVWSSRLGFPSDWQALPGSEDVLPEEFVPQDEGESKEEDNDTPLPLNQDPVYEKFYRMLRMVRLSPFCLTSSIFSLLNNFLLFDLRDCQWEL